MSITQNYTTNALKDGFKQYKGMSEFLSKRVYFCPSLGKGHISSFCAHNRKLAITKPEYNARLLFEA
jgi:hypothetical protein